ncbi:MAG: nucleoside triphosphate pyrophosphatase [Sedimenticolaceae bacterium]
MKQLVLASTSPFRKSLLEKLAVPFITDTPHTDETPHADEPPERLVRRLAEAKARDVASRHPDALIIGSDQVACVEGRVQGKPGSRENAIAQLSQASGRAVNFHTGLCLLDSATGRAQVTVEPFTVHFRSLARDQIERYVDHERPFDCAGSFKSEGYGITLFSALEGRDPNSLIGLPLIALVEMLKKVGIALP